MPDDPTEQFARSARLSLELLSALTDADWSVPAGELEWSCRRTIDHMVDCVFSYSLQLAGLRQGDWLPFSELHGLPDATPKDLIDGLGAVCHMFVAVLRSASPADQASDGVVLLALDDWAARGSYEVLLHTHDIGGGLGVTFEPPSALCAWMLGSTALWMFDRRRSNVAHDVWEQALLGSGRSVAGGQV